MSRVKIKINLEQVKTLCSYQCTEDEIAAVLKCSPTTLWRRIKEETGMTFAEFFEANRALGKISIRRSQFKLAEKNSQMAIFLGKNYLGQKDVQISLDNEYADVPEIVIGIPRDAKD